MLGQKFSISKERSLLLVNNVVMTVPLSVVMIRNPLPPDC